MRNLRNAMLVAVVAATALAAIAGYFLGGPPSRLLVDAGLAVALAVIVSVMLSPTLARTDLLIEALRALARGDRQQRVDPDQFAGLADVARAANEVAASLTEGDDPNLGPIKSVPRPGHAPRPANLRPAPVGDPVRSAKVNDVLRSVGIVDPIRLPPASDATLPPSDAPALQPVAPAPSLEPTEAAEIGPVRVLKKARGNGEKRDPLEPNETRKLPLPTDLPAPAASMPNMSPATNDTNIDDAPRSDIGSSDGDVAQVPSRSELEVLFVSFVAAKKSHGEAVADLDVDAFAQTIQGECERLIAAHRCKGVRFEVTMQDGEVSLRPRLLR